MKVLNSAVANAENNFGLDKANLVVSEAFANEGPTMKRFVHVRKVQLHQSTNAQATSLWSLQKNKEVTSWVKKVHPIGMRVGIIRDWDAKWYAEKEYADYLHEDLAIRNSFKKNWLTQRFQLLKLNAQ